MSESKDLTKINKDLLDKINSQKLSGKVTSLTEKISRFSQYKNATLLCDVSGSMNEFTSNGEARAIDVVRSTVENFPGAKIYEFSNYCKQVTNLSNPNGGTAMDTAFYRVKQDNISHVILITDGQPNSEPSALAAAKDLKIDIIYIGPEPIPEFLRKLAKACQGQFTSVALIEKASSKEIENKIKGFLSA